ncbi:MAG: DMT family transporter [Polyangiaceae bacterium]|nr:DMT family transporter [Polyangiaceae bacterium]
MAAAPRRSSDRAPLRPGSAVLFVAVAGAAFSTASPLARLARPLHPLTVALGRVAIAALLLCALDLRGVGRALAGLSGRQRAGVLGAGVLLAVHFALFLWGLDRTSLPAAVSLVSLEPLSVVLCSWLIFGIRPTRGEQIGVLLATGGAVLIAQGAGAGEHRLLGDLLVVGAVALYGFYVAAARGLRDALPARSYAALVYTGAAIALAVAIPFTPGALDGASALPHRSALAVLGLALIPTVVGHTAVQAAARWMSPSTVALVSPGETLGGIAIGAAALGAVPTSTELAGAAIILGGTTIAILGARRPSRAPAAARPD